VIDEFESASLRAVDTARSQANPALAVDAFSSELLVEPTQSLPPIVRQVVLLVLLLAFLLAGVVALEQVRRRATRQEARVGRGGQPAPAVHPVTTDWRHPGSTGR
jgi:hypothetical protein